MTLANPKIITAVNEKKGNNMTGKKTLNHTDNGIYMFKVMTIEFYPETI